jgi:hypothetical protein
MVWKDCGYFSLTKNGRKVSIIIKKVRYITSLEEVKDVLDGKRNYALIFEPLTNIQVPVRETSQ